MIDKLTYDQILAISKELKNQAQIIDKLVENRNVQELKDFAATVEGYSKFLESTIDKALPLWHLFNMIIFSSRMNNCY